MPKEGRLDLTDDVIGENNIKTLASFNENANSDVTNDDLTTVVSLIKTIFEKPDKAATQNISVIRDALSILCKRDGLDEKFITVEDGILIAENALETLDPHVISMSLGLALDVCGNSGHINLLLPTIHKAYHHIINRKVDDFDVYTDNGKPNYLYEVIALIIHSWKRSERGRFQDDLRKGLFIKAGEKCSYGKMITWIYKTMKSEPYMPANYPTFAIGKMVGRLIIDLCELENPIFLTLKIMYMDTTYLGKHISVDTIDGQVYNDIILSIENVLEFHLRTINMKRINRIRNLIDVVGTLSGRLMDQDDKCVELKRWIDEFVESDEYVY